MSQPYKLDQILSDEDYPAFRELLLNRRTTIRGARRWLLEHGYRICWGAVSSYRDHLLQQSLFRLRPIIGIGGDDDARRRLGIWAKTLSGESLTSLVLFAAYLVNMSNAAAEGSQDEIPGLMPIRRKGERTGGGSKSD